MHFYIFFKPVKNTITRRLYVYIIVVYIYISLKCVNTHKDYNSYGKYLNMSTFTKTLSFEFVAMCYVCASFFFFILLCCCILYFNSDFTFCNTQTHTQAHIFLCRLNLISSNIHWYTFFYCIFTIFFWVVFFWRVLHTHVVKLYRFLFGYT